MLTYAKSTYRINYLGRRDLGRTRSSIFYRIEFINSMTIIHERAGCVYLSVPLYQGCVLKGLIFLKEMAPEERPTAALHTAQARLKLDTTVTNIVLPPLKKLQASTVRS